jgi:hypothetical protein
VVVLVDDIVADFHSFVSSPVWRYLWSLLVSAVAVASQPDG